jgi:hypothetical protein
MIDLKECKIIDSIENIQYLESLIQTPCGNFLIGIEKYSIFRYCLETKQKFRIVGSVDQSGHQDGTRDESRFYWLKDLTLSKDLKTLFIADTWNGVIRAICVVTGVTTTFAGQVARCEHVDGPKENACFYNPERLKISPDGKTLYVADDNKLKTICIATGQVDTIYTFDTYIDDFTLSPDGKHIYICNCTQILKCTIETGKSKLIFKGNRGYCGCELSNNGQLLFILNNKETCIQIVNIVTNQVIDTITTPFNPYNITIYKNRLYIIDNRNDKIQVLDISKYCTNFKTFIQLQLLKYSFLPRQVIKRISI